MNYLDSNSSRDRCCICSGGAICFFALLLALAIGLILGAVFSAVILPALAAVIAFAAAIATVTIALLIYCCRNRRSD